MKPQTKPLQQKLMKMQPSLDSKVKEELNRLLEERIIFPIRNAHRGVD
jgi:hypothetical protein